MGYGLWNYNLFSWGCVWFDRSVTFLSFLLANVKLFCERANFKGGGRALGLRWWENFSRLLLDWKVYFFWSFFCVVKYLLVICIYCLLVIQKRAISFARKQVAYRSTLHWLSFDQFFVFLNVVLHVIQFSEFFLN